MDKLFDGFHGDRSLFASRDNPSQKFFSLKEFAPVVRFDDIQGIIFNRFIGRKFVVAFQTLPSAADNTPFLGIPRIYDFIVIFSANWATHTLIWCGEMFLILERKYSLNYNILYYSDNLIYNMLMCQRKFFEKIIRKTCQKNLPASSSLDKKTGRTYIIHNICLTYRPFLTPATFRKFVPRGILLVAPPYVAEQRQFPPRRAGLPLCTFLRNHVLLLTGFENL